MTSFNLLIVMLPIFMVVGVMLGLWIGRRKAEDMMVEVERIIQSDMTNYLRSASPVSPPERRMNWGALSFEETRLSRFRTFVWNVYMKARR